MKFLTIIYSDWILCMSLWNDSIKMQKQGFPALHTANSCVWVAKQEDKHDVTLRTRVTAPVQNYYSFSCKKKKRRITSVVINAIKIDRYSNQKVFFWNNIGFVVVFFFFPLFQTGYIVTTATGVFLLQELQFLKCHGEILFNLPTFTESQANFMGF